MKHRKAWAAILGIATIGLVGCPSTIAGIEEDSYLGLPTGQRPAKGDALPETLPPGGSSGGFNSGGSNAGSGTTVETGSNPTSMSLSGPLHVAPLYPQSAAVNVTISLAPNGVLALAAPSLEPNSVSVSWAIQGGYKAFSSQGLSAPSPLSDQAAKDVELRSRIARLSNPPRLGFTTSGMPVRTLGQNPSSVKIDATYSNVPVVVRHVESTGVFSDGAYRQKFVILVDQRDDTLLFGDSRGQTLLKDLADEIRLRIYPKNRALFGNDPSASEAQAKGLAIDTDTTYFVISRAVNQNGASGVLGYFFMGDLLPDDPQRGGTSYSNQAKMLYLSASQVQEAKAARARGSESGFNDFCGTIAHELQHLLFTWGRIKAVGLASRAVENTSYADAWIDEGLAMYAMAANGYGPEGTKAGIQVGLHAQTFLTKAPSYSLTTFYSSRPDGHPVPAEAWQGNPDDAYGMAYLFTQYLVDQQGPDIIGKILSSTRNLIKTGPVTPENIHPAGIVADAVEKDGGNLATVFGNFAAALALDGTPALAAGPESFRNLYQIQGVDIRKLRASGPAGVTRSPVTPRPFGVSYLKPSGLDPSESQLKLTGGSGLSSRLILHQ